MKRCARCLKEKALEDFSPSKRGLSKRHSYCKNCESARRRDRYAQDPTAMRAQAIAHKNKKQALHRGIVDRAKSVPVRTAETRFLRA